MIAWDSPEWGREGHNVTESETGSWLEAENGTSDARKGLLEARADHE